MGGSHGKTVDGIGQHGSRRVGGGIYRWIRQVGVRLDASRMQGLVWKEALPEFFQPRSGTRVVEHQQGGASGSAACI